MRITMGVDDAGRAEILLNLIESLRFPHTEVNLVHVVERWNGGEMKGAQGLHLDLIEKYLLLQEERGQKILEETVTDARGRGFDRCQTHLALGFISNQLIDHTRQSGSDLLALGTSGKRPLEGVLIGSVSRKAILGCQKSVIVAKGAIPRGRPLTVVLATDHSPYADACLTQFAGWAPQGVGKIVIVTVFPEQLLKALSGIIDHFKADIASWVRDELHQANGKCLEPFKGLGCAATSRVESGPVGDTLARMMEEEQGDLLVLGAQGHGFLDRLTMGSISLDQVVSKPYSVLVLRKA